MTAPQPLPGPLDEDPTRDVYALTDDPDDAERVARAMLAAAVVGVHRGAYDEKILAWLSGWDVATIATVASLMRRCWQSGIDAGRRETVDTTPTVARLTADIEAMARDLGAARDALDDIEDAYGATTNGILAPHRQTLHDLRVAIRAALDRAHPSDT